MSLSKLALNLSPEMVFELAMGLEPPYDVARRYGIEPDDLDLLMEQAWFQDAVYRRREQLSDEGQSFPIIADMMARDGFQRLFQRDKIGELKPGESIELYKLLGGYAGMNPKTPVQQGSGGPQFSINITVGEVTPGNKTILDASHEVIETKPMVIALEPELPAKPEGLRVPDFDLRKANELVGTPIK